MKDRIIEIVELGQPQSLIQRENAHITELIKTDLLIEELNEQLRLYNVSNRRELLLAFAEYMDSENDIFVPSWAVDNYINSK
jgi:uncharacterized membrane protein YcaP (DUF421 family)